MSVQRMAVIRKSYQDPSAYIRPMIMDLQQYIVVYIGDTIAISQARISLCVHTAMMAETKLLRHSDTPVIRGL